ERYVRRRSLGVFHQDAPGLHAANAPGSVSQQHDVARQAFYREVFVHRAHDGAFRLRDHGVQRIFGNGATTGDGRKAAAATGAYQRSAFQQVVAGSREDAAFGHGAAPVTRAADTLQAHRNGPRRANLANQINAADVDTQFERSRRYERADFSSLQLSFGDQSQLARQAAVMRGNGFISEAFGKMMRHAFCQATGIDKNMP